MLEIRKLRSKLLRNLKSENLSDDKYKEELGFFDKLVSRKDFIKGAGKLSLLGLMIDKGLMPSAWASETGNFSNPGYFTNSHKNLMASPNDDQSAAGIMLNSDIMKTAVATVDTNDVPASNYEYVLESFNPIVQAQADINQKSSDVGLNKFTKIYGHPEVVQLGQFNSSSADANTLEATDTQSITIHEYNPNGGCGHSLNKFNVSSKSDGEEVNLAFQVTSSKDNTTHLAGYNKVVAINGDSHNTYDSASNQILNQKMILTAFVYNEETEGEPTLDNWSADAQKNFIGPPTEHAPNQLKLYYQGGSATPAIAGEKITAANELNEVYTCINLIDILNQSDNYVKLVGQYPNLFGDGDLPPNTPSISTESNLRSHVKRNVANQITVKSISSTGYCGQNANSIYPKELSTPITGDACNIIHGTCCIGGIASVGFIINWGKSDDTPQVYFYGMNYLLKEQVVKEVNVQSSYIDPITGWLIDGFGNDSAALQLLRSPAFNYTFEAFTAYNDPTSNSCMTLIGAHGASGGSADAGKDTSLIDETYFTRLIDLKNDFPPNDCFNEFWNFSGDTPDINVTTSGTIDIQCTMSPKGSTSFTQIINLDSVISAINTAYGSGCQTNMNTIIGAFENNLFNFCAIQATNGTTDRLVAQFVIALDDALFQFNSVFSISSSEVGNINALNLDMLGYDQKASLIYKGGLTNKDAQGDESISICFDDEKVNKMHISVNHQGKINVYVGVNWDTDTNRLYSFAQDPGTGTADQYNLAAIDISLLYNGYTALDQGVRVLPWDNYFHDQEVVYVRPNKASNSAKIAYKAARKNAGLSEGSNDTEYVYSTKDYISKKWHTLPTKIQASQDNEEQWFKSTETKNAHHVDLFTVNTNKMVVDLEDDEYIEVRLDNPVSVTNYTDPLNPVNIISTRLKSFFIKPSNGKAHLNIFMDDADATHGLNMYYRIINKSQFSSEIAQDGTWNYDNSTSQAQGWYACNISYNAHDRSSNGYDQSVTSQDGSGGDLAPEDSVNHYSSGNNTFKDAVENNKKNGADTSKIQSNMTNGYSQANKAGAPTNSIASYCMLGDNESLNNPLNSIMNIGGSSQLNSGELVGSIWSDIGDAISDAWNALKNAIKETFEKIVKDVKSVADGLASLAEDIATGQWSNIVADIGACLKSISLLIVDCVTLVVDIITSIALLIAMFIIALLKDPGLSILKNMVYPLDMLDQNSYIRKAVPDLTDGINEVQGVIQDFDSNLKNFNIIDQLSGNKPSSKMHQGNISRRVFKKLKKDTLHSSGGISGYYSSQDDMNDYYNKSTKLHYTQNELGKNSAKLNFDSINDNTILNPNATDYINQLATAFSSDNSSTVSAPGFSGLNDLNNTTFAGSFSDGLGQLKLDGLDLTNLIGSATSMLAGDITIQKIMGSSIEDMLPSCLGSVLGLLGEITLEQVLSVILSCQFYILALFATCVTELAGKNLKVSDLVDAIENFNALSTPSMSLSSQLSGDVISETTMECLNLISQFVATVSEVLEISIEPPPEDDQAAETTGMGKVFALIKYIFKGMKYASIFALKLFAEDNKVDTKTFTVLSAVIAGLLAILGICIYLSFKNQIKSMVAKFKDWVGLIMSLVHIVTGVYLIIKDASNPFTSSCAAITIFDGILSLSGSLINLTEENSKYDPDILVAEAVIGGICGIGSFATVGIGIGEMAS